MKINMTGLLSMSDLEVHKLVCKFLDRKKIPYIKNEDFIVTKIHPRNTPLICTHIDTVSETKPKMFKSEKGILTAVNSKCLGADDRAGIFIALNMIHRGTKTKFEYAFFMGEESGCTGSTLYAKLHLPQHTCYIGLDRGCKGGVQNVALYGYDNDRLTSCFSKYKPSVGSVSDCSNIASYTGMACVNVSVGYQNEHTPREFLNTTQMVETMELMASVVIPEIEYHAEYNDYDFGWRGYREDRFSRSDSPREYKSRRNRGMNKMDEYFEPVLCENCGCHDLLWNDGFKVLCTDCMGTENDNEDWGDDMIDARENKYK